MERCAACGQLIEAPGEQRARIELFDGLLMELGQLLLSVGGSDARRYRSQIAHLIVELQSASMAGGVDPARRTVVDVVQRLLSGGLRKPDAETPH